MKHQVIIKKIYSVAEEAFPPKLENTFFINSKCINYTWSYYRITERNIQIDHENVLNLIFTQVSLNNGLITINERIHQRKAQIDIAMYFLSCFS